MNLYRKNLIKLTKNNNFLNSQNYVLGKKIISKIKVGMDIKKNGKNMIGYNKNKIIQEINITKINTENNQLKIFFIFFFGFFFIIFFLDAFKNGFTKNDLYSLAFIFIFMLFFIPPWFISFGRNKNFKFYRNNNRIIIYK